MYFGTSITLAMWRIAKYMMPNISTLAASRAMIIRYQVSMLLPMNSGPT